ncbi:Ig-like domain-containing protein [Herpetosiphon gulosus]|uniref:Peptidase M23 domain-containing protein n=1 Tax=Herpetosiphon gulosus TaxID=1973496 RepID=A0ABP9X487_9CHLR
MQHLKLVSQWFRLIVISFLLSSSILSRSYAQSTEAPILVDPKGLLSADLHPAVIAALGQPTINPTSSHYLVGSVRQEAGWALISLLVLEQPSSSELDHAPSILLLAQQQHLQWQAAAAPSQQFNQFVSDAPTTFLSANAKQILQLDPNRPQQPTLVEYKFPWVKDLAWALTSARNPAWHDVFGNTAALDFITSGADKRVLASAAGTITGICNGSNGLAYNVEIMDSDGVKINYVHLDQAAWDRNAIALGRVVQRGAILGNARAGTFSDCGNTNQQANSAHVHLVVPINRTIVMDGWTIQYPNNYLERNGERRGPGSFFTSSNALDSIPPVINFVAGPATERWYNTNQRIEWQISDPDSGVRGMSQAWDSTPPGPPPQFATNQGWLDFSGLSEGQHTVNVRAWDNAGNEASSSRGWFGYDISQPQGNISSPLNNTIITSPQLEIKAGASDSLSGVQEVSFYAQYNNTRQQICTSTGAPHRCQWTIPQGISDQSIIISIDVLDNAGNLAQNSGGTRSLILDQTAPVGAVHLNYGWGFAHGLAMPLNLVADGTGSPLQSMRLSHNGVDWAEWQPFKAWSWVLLTGEHQQTGRIYAQVKDYAGNTSATFEGTIDLNFYPTVPQSNHYQLPKSIHALGGTNQQSANYQIMGTIGQPIANNGDTTSSNYRLTLGYWGTHVVAEPAVYTVYLPYTRK